MLTRILTFSIEQRLLILALTGLLAGVGLWSAARLPIDAVPDVTNVQVQINANAPALSPLEVERQITYPVEVVFLPILTLEGVEGKLFKPMALTVAFALVGSLLLTFTLTPVLVALLLRGKISEKENFFIHWVKRGYAPSLDWCLAHTSRERAHRRCAVGSRDQGLW
jgi:Cu/Ag efflux pump CusA